MGKSSLAEELREAVDTLNTESVMVSDELAIFLMDNPIIIEAIEEDNEADVMEFLDELCEAIGELPTDEQIMEATGKKHDPFKRKSSLTTDAAIYGDPNPRGNVDNWECSCKNYKCTCKNTDTGGTKTVNMSKYYASGKKAKYMDSWREITSKQKKK